MMSLTVTTILALAVGALITLLDGFSRYNTRDRLSLAGPESATDPVDIPPRYFTSERGYLASVLLYLAAMETIYLLPAIVAPQILGPEPAPGVEPGWLERSPLSGIAPELREWGKPGTFPIIWALLLAGALRFLPWLNHLEPRIRRLCHHIAEIPHFVHEVARSLYTVEFDFRTAFPTGLGGDLLFVSAEHFNAPLSSEERGWARLSYIMREIEELNAELGNLPSVHFGARFAQEHQNAASEYRSLCHRMARYFDAADNEVGAGRLAALGADHTLKADLRRLLGRAELLLVILLNLKHRSEGQITTRLRSLGFKFDNGGLRTDSGPDAAVSVLALAVLLFIVSPVMAALVDVGMRALIGGEGRGWIVFPATILGEGELPLRVMVLFLLTFVCLLVLALGNLTIGRRFGGVDPREMFDGKWLHRPYDKYIRAALLPALLCYGTAVGMVYGLDRVGLAGLMPLKADWLSLALWIPALFVIGVLIQVFAQSKGVSFGRAIGEGLISGVVWAGLVFVTGFFFFSGMETIRGTMIPTAEKPGAAAYFALYACLVGAAFMAALLYISKSVRQAAVNGAAAEAAAAAPEVGSVHEGNVTALRRRGA